MISVIDGEFPHNFHIYLLYVFDNVKWNTQLMLMLIIVLLNQQVILPANLPIRTYISLLLFIHTLKRLQFQDFNLTAAILFVSLTKTIYVIRY
jgi:hypothetical protein